MKDNRVVDYPVYGGYDRKISSNSSGENIEYEYYCVPTSYISSDNAPIFLNIYPGYGSMKGNSNTRLCAIGVNPAYATMLRLGLDEVILKFPKREFILYGTLTSSSIEKVIYHSYSEYLKGLPMLSGGAYLAELADKILECAISEEEYNNKLNEIKSLYETSS